MPGSVLSVHTLRHHSVSLSITTADILRKLRFSLPDKGWAISTGLSRPIHSIIDLQASKVGVSRLGSGSHVMSFVLADQQGWMVPTSADSETSSNSPPFITVPLQTFANLRAAVNDDRADFFMWEYFTSKRYYTQGPDLIKKLGEIYTPWSSWKIVASTSTVPQLGKDKRLERIMDALDKGVAYFEAHQEEAVQYISRELDYSAEDAREWLGTVTFTKGVKGVRLETVEQTIKVLKAAGVVDGKVKAQDMIGIERSKA